MALNAVTNSVDGFASAQGVKPAIPAMIQGRAPSPVEGAPQVERRSKETTESAAHTIDSFVRGMGRELNFQVDGSSGKQIVRVSDPTTGEVVRQIPSEEAVQIARSLNYLQAVLVSIKA